MKKILALCVLSSLVACSGNPGRPYTDTFNDNRPGFQTEAYESKALTDATQRAIADFTKQPSWLKLKGYNQNILVGLFSDSSAYTKTRAVGRAAAKEFAKQMNIKYAVKADAFRLTDAMMRPLTNGYMSTTDEALHFARRQKAEVMVLGVTEVQANLVLVKLNIIDVENGQVILKYDYSIPVDSGLRNFIAKP